MLLTEGICTQAVFEGNPMRFVQALAFLSLAGAVSALYSAQVFRCNLPANKLPQVGRAILVGINIE